MKLLVASCCLLLATHLSRNLVQAQGGGGGGGGDGLGDLGLGNLGLGGDLSNLGGSGGQGEYRRPLQGALNANEQSTESTIDLKIRRLF